MIHLICDMSKNLVKFFSYVVKEKVEGLRALFGRKKLLYEDALLQGYELCIQTPKDLSDTTPKGSPLNMSPREIIRKNFGENYELYTIRAHPDKTVPGKIWYISPEEFEYLREWEMIDRGMSEDIIAKAMTGDGDLVTVRTYGLIKEPEKITKVIDSSYVREEMPTKKKLARKRQVRLDCVARRKARDKGFKT